VIDRRYSAPVPKVCGFRFAESETRIAAQHERVRTGRSDVVAEAAIQLHLAVSTLHELKAYDTRLAALPDRDRDRALPLPQAGDPQNPAAKCQATISYPTSLSAVYMLRIISASSELTI
jgi:hypothetical protein